MVRATEKIIMPEHFKKGDLIICINNPAVFRARVNQIGIVLFVRISEKRNVATIFYQIGNLEYDKCYLKKNAWIIEKNIIFRGTTEWKKLE